MSIATAYEAADPDRSASALGAISRRFVQLQKEYSGKGPRQIQSYLNDDLVTVVLRDPYTTVEQTLAREGQPEAVTEQRRAFQQVMNDRYIAVIEEELGRKVIAFMSNNHHDPDLSVEFFVLEPADAG